MHGLGFRYRVEQGTQTARHDGNEGLQNLSCRHMQKSSLSCAHGDDGMHCEQYVRATMMASSRQEVPTATSECMKDPME